MTADSPNGSHRYDRFNERSVNCPSEHQQNGDSFENTPMVHHSQITFQIEMYKLIVLPFSWLLCKEYTKQ